MLTNPLSTLASGFRPSKATSRSSPGVCGVSVERSALVTTRMVGSLSGTPLDPSGLASGADGTRRSAGTLRVIWATLRLVQP
jgi:hypothetical protein